MSGGLDAVRAELAALGDPQRAKGVAAFFKTGPGQYGEGDVFLGISVPQQRSVARAHRTLSLKQLAALLKSKIHEERLTALLILVAQYERGDEAAKGACFDFYLAHLGRVNNWDLVDASAYQIVGAHLLERDRKLLHRLAKSEVMWERRVAIVSTYAFIRAGEATTPFEIAQALLGDRHDLIHKAVGWMLREVGKRVSEDVLRAFLKANVSRLPRTTLRYAIERFPITERKAWLKLK
jgi:3-methyladenine DNA glycosylase AlkD